MMRNRHVVRASLVVALAFAFASLLLPRAARAQKISQTAKAGAYTVTLKVLPAESFSGPKAAMIRDSGAQPLLLNSPMHPNHHMVAFITKGGEPVENAHVTIRYCRMTADKMGMCMTLPVVRMHMAGMAGMKMTTTHFGNNVNLPPGKYMVKVLVNGSGPATFHFTL